jgi:hypothetical protein
LVLQAERHEDTEATKPKKLQEIKPLLPWNHNTKAASVITSPILPPLKDQQGNAIGKAAALLISPSEPKGNRYSVYSKPLPTPP